MSSELQRYVSGNVRPARQDRGLVGQAKVVSDDVRLRAFKVEGALALAGHIMEGVVGLDNRRRAMAQNDPITTALLADIQARALLQVQKIQAGLFEDWDL